MDAVLQWIGNNKEWIFSGVGVTAALVIGGFFSRKIRSKHKGVPQNGSDASSEGGRMIVHGNHNIIGDHNRIELVASKTDAKVQLVDLLFDEDEKGCFIDLKLRNTGDTVAFLKEVTFHLYDAFPMKNPQFTHYKLVPSTATYDFVLNADPLQKFPISQSIPANDVDRFRFQVASSIAQTRMVTIYYFSLSLVYNEDNAILETPRYIAPFPSTSKWAGCFVSGASMGIAKSNYLRLCEINQYDGIKSESFQMLFKSYEDSKKDFIHVQEEVL